MFEEMNMIRLFFEQPNREFNVREISRILKIAPATASKRLKELKNNGIVKHRKERILDLYKANLESVSYTDLKTYFNIKKIRESGIIEVLNEFYLKPAIILFGSASKGLDTETSDFDIVVISEKEKEFPRQEEFSKKIGRRLQLFVVKSLKDLRNKHLISSVLNGFVLQGEMQWI